MLRDDRRDVRGYYNPHHHYFRNRRVRGLKPEWLRLVRRSHVKVDASELVSSHKIANLCSRDDNLSLVASSLTPA